MSVASVPSSELYRQVQGRAACPGEFAVKPDAAQAQRGEQQKARSKWLQTSGAPLFHNFLFVLNALYCTFSAVHSEDSHTNNPYPTQRNPPPGSRLGAAAGILLLSFVDFDIF